MAAERKLSIGAIGQIGIVVRDVDETVRRYWHELGIGPWSIRTLGPGIPHRIFGKETSTISVRIAMAQVGPITLELIQPLTGPSPHEEFLAQHGEGLQHLGVFVEDAERAAETMRELGYEEILYARGLGPKGDGVAVYFDTLNSLGTLLEFIEPAKERGAPEKVYPPPGE